MATRYVQVQEAEVMAAVQSLYCDKLKPFGRIILKRLREQMAEREQRQRRRPVSLDEMPLVDPKQLRRLCMESEELRVDLEEGNEYSVTFSRWPVNAGVFVDLWSYEDPYPEELWQALGAYLEGLEGEEVTSFPGGRYSCARELLSRSLPCLAGLTLGEVTHIVQLALSKRGLLGYHDGKIVPFRFSDECVKQHFAAAGQPVVHGRKMAPDLRVASWGDIRHCLRDYFQSLAARGEPRAIQVSCLKNVFRSLYRLELSETALGYSRLLEALQDQYLVDICVVTNWDGPQTLLDATDPEIKAAYPELATTAADANMIAAIVLAAVAENQLTQQSSAGAAGAAAAATEPAAAAESAAESAAAAAAESAAAPPPPPLTEAALSTEATGATEATEKAEPAEPAAATVATAAIAAVSATTAPAATEAAAAAAAAATAAAAAAAAAPSAPATEAAAEAEAPPTTTPAAAAAAAAPSTPTATATATVSTATASPTSAPGLELGAEQTTATAPSAAGPALARMPESGPPGQFHRRPYASQLTYVNAPARLVTAAAPTALAATTATEEADEVAAAAMAAAVAAGQPIHSEPNPDLRASALIIVDPPSEASANAKPPAKAAAAAAASSSGGGGGGGGAKKWLEEGLSDLSKEKARDREEARKRKEELQKEREKEWRRMQSERDREERRKRKELENLQQREMERREREEREREKREKMAAARVAMKAAEKAAEEAARLSAIQSIFQPRAPQAGGPMAGWGSPPDQAAVNALYASKAAAATAAAVNARTAAETVESITNNTNPNNSNSKESDVGQKFQNFPAQQSRATAAAASLSAASLVAMRASQAGTVATHIAPCDLLPQVQAQAQTQTQACTPGFAPYGLLPQDLAADLGTMGPAQAQAYAQGATFVGPGFAWQEQYQAALGRSPHVAPFDIGGFDQEVAAKLAAYQASCSSHAS